ncbi:LamG-like jellyroll fold domain-containing protein, partial [Aquiflexum sp.]|uniref:LamG-like jellyroll fold domain-containing protein n=1 Tax=Aquiflexum sp. TaxID=1872584 RepID=UPI0035945D2F
MRNPILFGKKIQVIFSILTFLLSFQVLFGQSVQFDLTTLNFNGFASPSQGTALKFGPDNKLYLAQLNGLIRVYTIESSGHNSYSVTALQTISHVRSIPNHDDIGTPAWDGRSNRQITGIEVVGTAENPIIYVGSSDPKWGGPSGDKVLDTNSGIITKLTWTGTAWDVVDLVRGLPRSEENHSTNAVKHTLINNKPFLLVASGGFTNAGAPSTNFTWVTEYALSAAILSVDLDAIEALPTKTDPNSGRKYKYDIPTLDDPSRPNVNGIYNPNQPGYDGIDVGDPFGGNDGLNMAMLVAGGPVQIFSPGYRNAYDFVVTEAGKVFVTDNGPNASWGGLPENEGNANTVSNNYLTGEPGTSSTRKSSSGEYVTNKDRLLMITNNINNYQPGSFYGGHPAPIRANPGNPYTAGATFPFNPGGAGLYTKSIGDEYNGTTLKPLYTQNEIFRTQILQPIAPGSPGFDQYAQTSLPANWPPVPLNLRNLNEADYRDPFLGNLNGPQLEIVTMWKINSNGLDEYKASNFGGVLKGSLIAGRNSGYLHLVRLNQDGSLLSLEEDKWNLNGGNSLGVNCQGDNEIFPGTIWVATYNNIVHILTPSNNPFCPSPNDPFFDPDADYDNDGYTNQDEIDNGTDYCSGASRPNDFDGDFVSDLNDLDDDGDGILDALDPFQLGSPTDLPIDNELFSDKTDDLGRPFGYRGLGLTGLMNNGAPNPNWMNWLDKLDEGPLPNDIYGGAAGAIQIALTGGTANGSANNQEKGFQFGVNVGVETGEFLITGALLGFQGSQMFYDIDHNGELGIQMGDGTQSNFLKLVFTKTGILAGMEINDIPDPNPLVLPLAVGDRPLSSETVEFMFRVNPINGNVIPQIKIGQRPIMSLGTKTLTGKILEAVQNFSKPLAIGVIGTSGNQGVEFLATYDYFRVFGERPFITNPLVDISRQVGSPSKEIDLSDYFDDHGGFENLTFSLQNTNPNIGAIISGSILTINFPNSPANGTITVKAEDANGYFVEQSFEVTVFASEQIVFRINAGGQIIEGQNSYQDWKSNDSNGSFNGDGYTVDSGIVKKSDLNFENRHSSIPNYIDAATFNGIFSNEREKNGQGSMVFSIPIEQGEYIVRLYFGNSGSNTSNIGDRFFDIKIEGQLVYNDLDLVQRFGHGSAGMEEFSADVNDGLLNIEFIKQTGNPTISAIEVLRAVSPPPPLIFLNPVQDQISTVNEVLEGNLLFTASGGVGTLHYSAINLPPGVDIEPANGRLYGTIASIALANSPYNVTVTVTDSNSPEANSEFVTFTWTILPFETWNPVNENQNYTRRHENSFVQAGEHFYMMGGRENALTIDVYNYNQDTWKAIENIAPFEFNHFQAITYKGYIWVIGAFQTNNFPDEIPASHIWLFDPVNEQYIQGPEIPLERRRGSAGLVLHNDKFYIVGGNKLGHKGEYVPYFDEFDPATGIWTILEDAPRPRDHFSAVLIGEKIYVASGRLSGGFGGTFGPVIKEVDVFDFVTQEWSTLPSALDIPTARAGAIAANFENKLLIAGGEVPDNTEALDITELYDPEIGTWTTGNPLNFRRHGTQGIVSGKGLFVAGGSPNRGGGRMRNMEFYGLNNPIGTPITESILSGPENIILGSDNKALLSLTTTNGNQGVFMKDLSFTGVDANDFHIASGNLTESVISPNIIHNIALLYQGTKESPVANLVIQYKTNSSLLIPIQRSSMEIESFTLINANNTSDIQDIVHGTQLSLTQVQGLSLNFRANSIPSAVGSVLISLTGPVNSSRLDNDPPYTLLDNDGFDFPVGNYTLTATPYSQSNGSGNVGQALSIDFSIVGSGSTPVSDISVSPSTASILIGNTQQITATVSPSNATNKTVIWSTSNANIATVSSTGLVTGIAQGTANITAQTEDGGFTAVSSITVEQSDFNYLAGHWKMDEGSGNILIDHSDNGNDATIQNISGVTWSPGVIGLALDLNGNKERFGIAPHNASLEIGESITIAGWMKPNVLGRNTIISKSDGNGFELTLNNDGFIHFFLNRGNSGGSYRLVSKFNYGGRLDEWLHVAATYDGNTSRIFVNGIEDASTSFGPLNIGTASGGLSIGAYGSIQRFKGSLDDLRLYGRALEESEIFTLFNGEAPLLGVPQLLAPADGNASVIAPEVQLSWLAVDFASGYKVQLAADATFSSLLQDVDTGSDLSFTIGGLLPETEYFWRVRSYIGEVESAWSETRSFTTVAAGS